MLATAAIVEAGAAAIRSLALHVRRGSVMVSKSGARLLDEDGELMMRAELLACAEIATPNIPEGSADGWRIDRSRRQGGGGRDSSARRLRCHYRRSRAG